MPRTPMAAATPPTTKRVPTAARKATVNRRASAAPRVRQEATAGSAVAAARPGRPRDPSIDHRAVQAALQIYSDHGLAGLSFEQVSRQSSVGKAALYSRWHDVESLLIDGLRTIAPAPAVPDSGSLRQDLRQLTLMLCRLYSGSYGRVTVRILLDASLTPALRPYYEDFTAAYVRAATAIVER